MEGIDCKKIISLNINFQSIKILKAIVVCHDIELHLMNVKAIILYDVWRDKLYI